MTSQELLAAITALRASDQTPASMRIGAMIVIPVVVALIVGILGWVGTGVSGVSTSVAQIQISLAGVQKTVDSLSTGQNDITKHLAEIDTRLARHDDRLNNIDALDQRINDRVRIAEGQKPLHPVEPF